MDTSTQPAHPPAEAVVLVGGKGTRLRPLTCRTPKPMLPTGGVPFLEHLLARIKQAGITRVVLGTSFRREVFEDYFGDGSKMGLDIQYVFEEKPLGTGGAIRNVLPKLTHDTVIVFNGDVFGGLDLNAILDNHHSTGADVTMHLVRVSDPRAYGCVPTDASGRVQAFLEKTMDPPTDQINAGCYVFKKEIIESIPAGKVVSVERDIFPGLLDQGKLLQGFVDTSYWRDMGTPHDFVRGSSDLVRGIVYSPVLKGKTGESIVHESACVKDGVLLLGGTVVGRGTEIGAGCRIDDSAIFDGVTIEPGAIIKNSIIADGAHIGPNARVFDCLIGEGASIGARCELRKGMRVWPGVTIPDGGIRFSTDA
ncbi:sugar phosphate nucleotidyltransferase [Corynebacterium mendelii]|uniref:NDP-sugar synthase n=1 Tax=Corynebacterium mendelii TaxID=2765362 RepID=A0A939IYB0_9CORY|nr:NDP-sugar synthase [Corynebacterium mendelii]MBN9644482.1 NDP-sugar synthase [Corynebacterium mendelii]